jgi:hypothetical protein
MAGPPPQTPEEKFYASRTMRLASGKLIDPLDLKVEDVCAEDIAHGLSLVCRFGGHCSRHYSVAEHSYLVARLALDQGGPVAARFGLFHDAHEAYTGDMIRPLKHRPEMQFFRDAQDVQQDVIERALGLADTPKSVRDLVQSIDRTIVVDEHKVLFAPRPGSLTAQMRRHYPALDIAVMSPEGARAAFLAAWRQLNEITP